VSARLDLHSELSGRMHVQSAAADLREQPGAAVRRLVSGGSDLPDELDRDLLRLRAHRLALLGVEPATVRRSVPGEHGVQAGPRDELLRLSGHPDALQSVHRSAVRRCLPAQPDLPAGRGRELQLHQHSHPVQPDLASAMRRRLSAWGGLYPGSNRGVQL